MTRPLTRQEEHAEAVLLRAIQPHVRRFCNCAHERFFCAPWICAHEASIGREADGRLLDQLIDIGRIYP